MAKNLALDYGKYNIRVNCVCPTLVHTPMGDKVIDSIPGGREAALEDLNKEHPLGRLAMPKDVAYGILYLVSDEASYVTGTTLVIDGGITAK